MALSGFFFCLILQGLLVRDVVGCPCWRDAGLVWIPGAKHGSRASAR